VAAAGTFVFGYGSLALLTGPTPARTFSPDGFVADLAGYVRGWGVAMDNRADVPGYKRYRTPEGERPAAHVCFLDIAERPGGRVNGVCLPVDETRLAALDRRERNYVRHDVSDRVAGAAGAVIYAYVGSPEGRARLVRGCRDGDAVIATAYLAAVRAGFDALGTAEAQAAAPSLDPAGIPVMPLCREDLAG
jgi:hypothetical protein